MNVLDFAKQKMIEAGKKNYQVTTQLVAVRPGQTINHGVTDTYYFSANFQSYGDIKGVIENSLGQMTLENHYVGSQIAKIRAFRGSMKITNMGLQMLYIELLSVTPVEKVKNEQDEETLIKKLVGRIEELLAGISTKTEERRQ